MNPVTVLQCTQGIVAYLEKNNDLEKLKSDGVVIGYDHRDDKAGINSEMMACAGWFPLKCACACRMTAHGIPCIFPCCHH